MFCDLQTLKLKCFTTVANITFGQAAGGSSGLPTQNGWYHQELTFCGNTDATFQDISHDQKSKAQTGLPN